MANIGEYSDSLVQMTPSVSSGFHTQLQVVLKIGFPYTGD